MSLAALTETRVSSTRQRDQVMHFVIFKSSSRELLFYQVNASGVGQGMRTYTMGGATQDEVMYLIWALNCNARLLGCIE
jgi:hypothetical protein